LLDPKNLVNSPGPSNGLSAGACASGIFPRSISSIGSELAAIGEPKKRVNSPGPDSAGAGLFHIDAEPSYAAAAG